MAIMTDERRNFFQTFIKQILNDPRKFEGFLRDISKGKNPSWNIKGQIPGYASTSKASAEALLHNRITGEYFASQLKQDVELARTDELSFQLKSGQNPKVEVSIFLEDAPPKYIIRILAARKF